MSSDENGKIGAVVLRIVLFANLIATMAYSAVIPQEMSKVTSELATIGIAGIVMVVQIYVTLAVYTPLPYRLWIVIGLDGLCAASWGVAIAMLSYWDRKVVYSPRHGDPATWFQCANAKNSDMVWTDDGIGSWIHLVWCKVEIDGRSRLIGNAAARQQLHVLIGLSAVSLLFTGLIIYWTVKRAQFLGLIKRP